MAEKLVSVIMPVYNVEPFVTEAIVSIQNQTYKNLEIIIIDDGSSDNTYKIVLGLSKQDHRIRLLKNKNNLKIVKTLNRALSLANGEYIARMDGDDISELSRIEKKVDFLEKNIEMDLVGCSMKAIDIDGNVIGQNIHFSDQMILEKTLPYVTPISHIWVARKSLYDNLNGYREILGVEDYDFLLRMRSLGYKYTNLENYFGYFVRLGREGNTINNLGITQRKMQCYAYKLFLERKNKNGTDSFSEGNMRKALKSSHFFKKIHIFSAECLYKAIEAKGHKDYIKMMVYLIISLVSPYQIEYLYKRFNYKWIIRRS